MQKTILITGATDGIGLETARQLVSKDHNVLLHGRNPAKLDKVKRELSELSSAASIESYIADLSNLLDVVAFAKSIRGQHQTLDALINNAGIYGTSPPITSTGIDVRFVVNTIAPYLLTKQLLPLMEKSSRVVNLSSAAQAPVDIDALSKTVPLSDGLAYAQSKLALTMWSRQMAIDLGQDEVAIIAVNPKSMLGSKMVKEAYGVVGADLSVGADILVRAAISDEFKDATGQYFDNDIGQFASPHPDALDSNKCIKIIDAMEEVLNKYVAS